MKILKLIFILLSLNWGFSFKIQAQQFSRIYDRYGKEMSFSIILMNDGYVISGGEGNYTNSNGNVYIMKLNFQGDTLWSRSYGDTAHHYFAGGYGGMTMLPDSGFAMCGSRTLSDGSEAQMILYRFNKSGDTLFTQEYGYTGFDSGNICRKNSLGGFYLCGETGSMGDPDGNFLLIKTDALGNLIWKRTFGGGLREEAVSMEIDSEDNVYMAGYSYTYTSGPQNIGNPYIVKTDSAGNKLWHKPFLNADSVYSQGSSGFLYLLNDTGLIFSYSKTRPSQKQIPILSGIDTAGNVQWTKTIGPRYLNNLVSITASPDGNLIAAGQANTVEFPSAEDIGGFIMKFTPAGDSIWARYYYVRAGQEQSFLLDIDTTEDKGYIATGGYWDRGPFIQDIWVIKVDSNGCLSPDSCGVLQPVEMAEEIVPESIKIYPNPGTGLFNLDLPVYKNAFRGASKLSSESEKEFQIPIHNPAREHPLILKNPAWKNNQDMIHDLFSAKHAESEKLSFGQELSYTLCIYDQNGILCYSKEIYPENNIQLDLRHFTSGLYYLLMRNEQIIYTAKLCIVK